MQHKARMRPVRARRVERVSEDRVTDFAHMYPELMTAPGLRKQTHPGFAAAPANHAPLRQRRASRFMVDLLKRPVRPVDSQRQVDSTGVLGDFAGNAGQVGLSDLALLELEAEVSLGVGGQRENHDA